MIRNEQQAAALEAAVRRFVEERWWPIEAAVEAADAVPEQIVEELRQRGFFGWSIPEKYGGLGLTSEELVRAAFQLSRCSVALRARVGTNTGIGSEALVVDGTEEQKERWLPLLASGAWTSCLALD